MFSGLGALSQLGGSFVSGLVTARGARKQFKNQLQLQQNEFENNREMWNLQNEYNTPSAQIQRLDDAGLNPRLIYGNGTASTGQASGAPSYSAPNAPNYGQAFNEASVVALDAISNLLQRQESLKSQRLDNAMKAVDLENYIDSEDTFSDPYTLDDNGNPVVTVSRRPGLGSIKRSQALENLVGTQYSNYGTELENAWKYTRNDRAPALMDAEIGLKRATISDTRTRELQRKLQNKLLDLEYRWFNSSKFVKNVAPFLRLLNPRGK